MKQLISDLSSVIHEDFILKLSSSELEIKEENSDEDCRKVIFKFNNKQIFAFSLDNKLEGRCKIFPFFNQSTENINKVNDAIVFYCKSGKIYVFLIELKSKQLGDYKKQLHSGKNFALYLVRVLNSSFSKCYTLEEKNIKCLVFSLRKTGRKQGTKRKNIKYEPIDGLNIAELQCNNTHIFEKFI